MPEDANKTVNAERIREELLKLTQKIDAAAQDAEPMTTHTTATAIKVQSAGNTSS